MAAYAALVSLMHIIDELQHHPRPPISLNKNQADLLTRKVASLKGFLEGYNINVGYSAEADPLEGRIADAAHAAEDLIESYIVDNIPNQWKKTTGLYQGLKKVIEGMAMIEKEGMEIEEIVGVQHQLLHTNSATRLSSISLVGVDNVLLEMMDKLTRDQPDLQIIPIVGMGGIGKTALATNVFQAPLIQEYFDICAWVTISRRYTLREIVDEILNQVNKKERLYMSEEELGVMLHKDLSSRRYMIILDDVWSNEMWDDVLRFFPDNKNGSRIVITTRLSSLASNLAESNSLEMRFLDEANSWDLLSKTVFGEESCPLELEGIGKRIGKSCRGLPLSIVVIGGFLARSEHTREFWESIEENLNTTVNLVDDERCLRILHVSYKQLPVHLKPCFLYMGVFPEDSKIRVSRLTKLWVAEGFLKPASNKSLEEIAEEHLKDLISRNLILIHELGSTGNIKYCKIHDILRDFCLREAQKERFYNVGTPHEIARRIVISSASKKEAVDALQSMSLARSLIWNLEEVLPWLSFRFLRILDVCAHRSSKVAQVIENMLELVNSRYLAITILWEWEFKLPSSIHLFWNLQTLIVDDAEGIILPAEIWYMPQIRHVKFKGLYLPDPPSGHVGGQDNIVLGNLQTMVTVKNFKCSEEMVKRIPHIKKLRVSYPNLEGAHSCLSNLVYLHNLESFGCHISSKISPNGPDSLQSLNFPVLLKKLTLLLSSSQCWQGILEKIGTLPLLEKLKLYNGCFEGCKWETADGQFCSLKFLEICNCSSLQLWATESSHFPCLEHLVLEALRDLNEIPLDIAEIPTLQKIDLRFCSDSAVISAKRIVEEQESFLGEVFVQVQVMLSMKNQEALQSLAGPNFRVKG